MKKSVVNLILQTTLLSVLKSKNNKEAALKCRNTGTGSNKKRVLVLNAVLFSRQYLLCTLENTVFQRRFDRPFKLDVQTYQWTITAYSAPFFVLQFTGRMSKVRPQSASNYFLPNDVIFTSLAYNYIKILFIRYTLFCLFCVLYK